MIWSLGVGIIKENMVFVSQIASLCISEDMQESVIGSVPL